MANNPTFPALTEITNQGEKEHSIDLFRKRGTAVFINLASLQSKAHCTNGWVRN